MNIKILNLKKMKEKKIMFSVYQKETFFLKKKDYEILNDKTIPIILNF